MVAQMMTMPAIDSSTIAPMFSGLEFVSVDSESMVGNVAISLNVLEEREPAMVGADANVEETSDSVCTVVEGVIVYVDRVTNSWREILASGTVGN